MRNYCFPFLYLILIFSSCSEKDNFELEENKFKTGIDMSATYRFDYQDKGVSDNYFMIGYGYDMTGKFAHPASVKDKIVNIEAYKEDHEGRVIRSGAFFTREGLSFEGTEQESREKLAVEAGFTEEEIAKYKNLFKEVITPAFRKDTAFSNLEYRFCGLSQIHSWYVAFLDFDTSIGQTYDKYLTEEFKRDVQEKSPDEIIKLYGTHVLMKVNLGERADFIYRTTSRFNGEYHPLLESKLLYNRRYFSLIPLTVTSDSGERETSLEKENIYFEAIGGKNLKEGLMIDVTNYSGNIIECKGWNQLADSNLALIGFTDPLPIYKLVTDNSKKEALKLAVEKYLSE